MSHLLHFVCNIIFFLCLISHTNPAEYRWYSVSLTDITSTISDGINYSSTQDSNNNDFAAIEGKTTFAGCAWGYKNGNLITYINGDIVEEAIGMEKKPWEKIRYTQAFWGAASCWYVFAGSALVGPANMKLQSGLIPFQPNIDKIVSNDLTSGSWNGETYRCDNQRSNFWHASNGYGYKGSLRLELRRDFNQTTVGIATDLDCVSGSTGFKYSFIEVGYLTTTATTTTTISPSDSEGTSSSNTNVASTTRISGSESEGTSPSNINVASTTNAPSESESTLCNVASTTNLLTNTTNTPSESESTSSSNVASASDSSLKNIDRNVLITGVGIGIGCSICFILLLFLCVYLICLSKSYHTKSESLQAKKDVESLDNIENEGIVTIMTTNQTQVENGRKIVIHSNNNTFMFEIAHDLNELNDSAYTEIIQSIKSHFNLGNNYIFCLCEKLEESFIDIDQVEDLIDALEANPVDTMLHLYIKDNITNNGEKNLCIV